MPTDRVGRGAERSPVTRRRRVGAPDEAAEFVGCPGDSGPGGKEKGKFMSQTFEGTTIAVTGGGSGIGAAISETLARRGAAVAVLDINLANARSVAERIGGTAFEVDVTDEKQVAATTTLRHHRIPGDERSTCPHPRIQDTPAQRTTERSIHSIAGLGGAPARPRTPREHQGLPFPAVPCFTKTS